MKQLPSAASVARNAIEMAKTGSATRAVQALRQRIEDGGLRAGEAAELRLVQARILLDSGRAKASVAELVEVLRVDAHRPDALLLLTDALIACDQPEKARESLERAHNSGADASRVNQLKLKLEGEDVPGDGDDIAVLISEESDIHEHVTTAVPPVVDQTIETRPIKALQYSDDEGTVPRFVHEEDLLNNDADFDEWDLTRVEKEDPEEEFDTSPRKKIRSKHLRETREVDPISDRRTVPRAWSIGDPGRSAVSPSHAPPPRFEDETITGSFNMVSGEVLGGLDEEIRRRNAKSSTNEPEMLFQETRTSIKVIVDESIQQVEPLAILSEDIIAISPIKPPAPSAPVGQLPPSFPAQRNVRTPAPLPPESLSTSAAPRWDHLPPEDPPVIIAPQPSRPQSRRRHHHSALASSAPAPAPAPAKELKNDFPELRQSDLMSKLAAAAKRQSDRAKTGQSPKYPSSSKPNLKLLATISASTLLLAIVLTLSLVVFPVIHSDSVVGKIDDMTAQAKVQTRLDTYEGHLRAQAMLTRALSFRGPLGAPFSDIVETYLEFLGNEEHLERRGTARRRLTLVKTTLETRFDVSSAPSASSLLADLDPDQFLAGPEAAASRAAILIRDGKAKEAISLLETARRAFPSDAHLIYLQGRARRSLGDEIGAKGLFETARKLDEGHIPSRFELGRTLARAEDPRAMELFNDILARLSPEHVDTLIERSYLRITRDGGGEPIKDLHLIINEFPADKISPSQLSRAHLALAMHHQRAGETDKALKALESAQKTQPASLDVQFAKAEVLLDADRLQEAKKVLPSLGQTPRAHRLEARLEMLAGFPQRALDKLNKTRRPQSRCLQLKGEILIESARWREAQSSLEAAVSKDPRNPGKSSLTMVRSFLGRDDALRTLERKSNEDAAAALRYGRALLQREQPALALPHLVRSEALDPQGMHRFRLPPSHEVCQARNALNKQAEAQESCRRAILKRPTSLPPYLLLAQIQSSSHEDAAALETLKVALKYHPDDTLLQTRYVRALTTNSKFDEASTAIRALVGKDPNLKGLLALQGFLEFKKHQHLRAIGYFERALEAKAGDPEVELHLALSLLAVGRFREAKPHLTAAKTAPSVAPQVQLALAEYHRQDGVDHRSMASARRALTLFRRRGGSKSQIAMARTAIALAHELGRGLTHNLVQSELAKASAAKYSPAFYHEARVARALNRPTTFLVKLRKAVSADPYYCPAVRLLRIEASKSKRVAPPKVETCR